MSPSKKGAIVLYEAYSVSIYALLKIYSARVEDTAWMKNKDG